MLLTALLFSLAAHPIQSDGFEDLHLALQGEPIAFVHIEAESPQSLLAVYSSTSRLAVWPTNGLQADDPLALMPSERFVLSPKHDALAVLYHAYPCLEGLGLSRVATFTELRFPVGLPNGSPITTPPLPAPDPLPAFDSAARAHLSERALMLAFIEAGHHLDEPGRVRLLRRANPSESAYSEAGSYTFTANGEFQSSSDGDVIAHAEGTSLRLFDGGGKERARLPLQSSFFLSPDGRWLTRWIDGGLAIDDLREPLGAPVATRAADLPGPPLQVVYSGNRALVLTRNRATLLSLDEVQVAWTRDASLGTYSSCDLIEPSPGRTLVALGELDVLRVPMRNAAGLSRVRAEVFELATNERLTSTEFEVGQWNADQPRVRLTGTPSRLVVVTAERARISPPLP